MLLIFGFIMRKLHVCEESEVEADIERSREALGKSSEIGAEVPDVVIKHFHPDEVEFEVEH